ncbi:MAG TPA: MBOAT family O-acyltransferase [Bacteroidales bacterium]|nr:MBOAT family O-acyltransferase [Bacteroidales bacterium]HRZ48294.1 MBOAT family O-acyltransferase [Bacteroidales bacterium]
MVFNSLEFLLFFPLVVAGYYLIPFRFRWMLLLAASYYFYMCWKLEYVFLILFSTLVDYVAGIMIEKNRGRRPVMTLWLIFSLVLNLGLLFTFKYFNFFNENLRILFNAVNIVWHVPSLNLLLPVGISFYTFQTLSYTIEVYRGNYRAEKHPGYFALYVSYFPQLVAGPIERPGNLLPQLRQQHSWTYDNVTDGLKLMAWGFFKKLVIADRIAVYVDPVFADPSGYYGLNMLIPAMLLHIRVYCDFSAYSDIAIGAARIMGVQLSVNFDRPMFATSFRSFWRKWHITLTRFVMDYIFKPLISRVNHWGTAGRFFAIVMSFSIIGLWHGAAWGMVLFGFFNGLLVASESVKWPWQRWMDRFLHPRIVNFLNGVFVFVMICTTVVCFGAGSLPKLSLIYHNIFSAPLTPLTMQMFNGDLYSMMVLLLSIALVAIVEFAQKDQPLISGWINRLPWYGRWLFYLMIITLMFNFGLYSNKAYIYFQF